MGRKRDPNSKTRPQTLLTKHERGYTDADYVQAIALYSLYGNQAQVARELKIPVTTVHAWIHDEERRKTIVNYDQRLKETQDRLMQSMGFVAEEALQQVHRKLPDASAAQAATIYGILFDKQQMIAGNTGTNVNFSVDVSGMDAEAVDSLLKRVLDRRQNQVVEAEGQIVQE